MQYTIKQARVLNDFTQAEMAQKIGVCRSTYIKIERNPNLATVEQAKKISEVTGIPVNNIFFVSNST